MLHALPHVVAALNALAAVLVSVGFVLVRAGRRAAHRRVMTAAVIVSALFLVAYLVHHALAPTFVFPGQGLARPIYFTLLASHVGLAVAVTPLVVLTYLRGAGGAEARHRRLARWTLPVWLYVSVTGIVVYVWLYLVYGTQS